MNFKTLVDARNIKNIQNELHLDNKVSILICSEDKPEKCHRRLVAEMNVVNYIGAIVSITFIWSGTKIFKFNRIKTANPQREFLPKKPTLQPKQQTPQKTAFVISKCAHQMGYLSQRQKQQEIPAECFTCEKLIQCMGSTT